jgi:hypothetical protein
MASAQTYEREKWFFIIIALMSIIIVAVSVLFLTTITGGSLERSTTIGSAGTVKAVGVGVFSDSNCTNRVSSISWSFVEPGSLNNATVYIRNEENSPVTLNLNTTNWNPTSIQEENYMILTWDYANQTLKPNDNALPVKLTLAVYSNVTGITDFSFDIIITGTG